MQTAVHCYRYALRPTPTQVKALAHAQAQARRLWNEMVALLRWAEREQRHGRREASLHEYGRILAGKAITGAAATKARKIMAERGLASEPPARFCQRAGDCRPQTGSNGDLASKTWTRLWLFS